MSAEIEQLKKRIAELESLIKAGCSWEYDQHEGMWHGACGAIWLIDDKDMNSNCLYYCPKCGGSIEPKQGEKA